MIANYSVRKPFTIMVAVILVIILGVVSLTSMTTDLLPSITLPYAIVMTTYPGASPEEVEAVVTRTLEQSMASLSNIKNVNSISRENMSLIILEFTANVNMDTVFIEMRENLDMVKTYMPSEIGNPMMLKLNPDMMPVMVASVAMEEMKISETSQFVANNILHEFESVEGVASVSTSGLVESGIHVLIRDEKINAVNAELDQMFSAMGNPEAPKIAVSKELVAGILKGQNFSMPAGYIAEDGVDYLVRTGEKIESIEELEQLAIVSLPLPNLAPITLADVADIVETDNSGEMYSKLNGNDAVVLSIQKQSEYSTADVAQRLRKRAQEAQAKYPGLQFVALMDQGVYVDVVVGSITNNLLVGGALALLILLLFLRDLRPTIVVGIAIPISLVTALVLMFFSKVTLNIISMGGLALGVGMLVDNSIVVIENIYRMRSEGKSPREAAVEGTKEVAGAIAASTLTTVSVFLPILFTKGLTKQIFADMGLTIAYSLFASLAIAITLVPMLASRLIAKKVATEGKRSAAVKAFYGKSIRFFLRHKALVIIAVVILFVGSLIGAFRMGTEFFPSAGTGQLMVNIAMPDGSSMEDTVALADKVAAIIGNVEYVDNVGASLGGGMGLGMLGFGGGGSQNVSIYVLVDEDNVSKTPSIIKEIKEKTEGLNGEISVTDSGVDMSSMLGGAGIEVVISGREFSTLEKIAGDVAGIVGSVPGTENISPGVERTEPEIRVIVNKDKSIAYGLTVAQVFGELNRLLKAEAADTTLTIDNIDYEIRVKDALSDRELSLEELENLEIPTPFGSSVPLKDIAAIGKGSGYRSIRRENQQRTLTVTADLKDGYNIGLVSQDVEAKLADYHGPEGYRIKMGGERERISTTFADLYLMLALAVAFIYLIMVAQFQSLLSPFIVMFTIPLAFTGGFLGLIITGNPISVVAFIGLIILAGVVVNNGIVFIDYINVLRRSGLSKKEAIVQAGTVRMRPILMTALTTIIALSTMSLGVGTGTEIIQPMAITTIGGLIYATLLTLVLVPVLYDIAYKDKPLKTED